MNEYRCDQCDQWISYQPGEVEEHGHAQDCDQGCTCPPGYRHLEDCPLVVGAVVEGWE